MFRRHRPLIDFRALKCDGVPMITVKLPPDAPSAELVVVTQESMRNTMLKRSGRGGVPIRSEFVQRSSRGPDGDRSGPLSRFVRNHDQMALDVYLLIHAVSSAAPWESHYPAASWVTAVGLDRFSSRSAAITRFSRILRRLADARLLLLRELGRKPHVVLLREDGSGDAYFRPQSLSHGPWFSIPYTYWTFGYAELLSLPAKAMLLIAMSSPEPFTLPLERVHDWYGISTRTAERGLKELAHAGLIRYSSTFRVEPSSPIGVTESRQYQLLGNFAMQARRKAMRRDPALIRRSRPTTSAGGMSEYFSNGAAKD